MAELKKCPFCKSENLYIIHDKKSIKRNTFVECQNCKATAPIEAWNNRVTEAEIGAKVEHTYENCHNITCRRKCQKDGYNMAIDEFAEKLNAKIEEVYSAPERESEYNHAWKTVCRIIQGNMEVIAEQLNGE